MKMKVLQINVVYGVGSTGKIVKDLANVMEQDNIESYIAYGYGKSSEKNTIKIGTKLEYYIHNILSRITGKQGRYSYFATKRFLKKVDKIKPDIIHLHNIHGNYINYTLLFKYIKKNRIPIVWTLHDCWAYTGKCVYYDYNQCNKWKKKCEKCRQLKEYPTSYFFDSSENEYENKKKTFTSIENMYIVTPSNWLAKEVKESYLGKYPIQVIPNGIDLTQFKKIDSDFRPKHNIEDKFVILGVANEWSRRKGANTFIELAKLLDDSYKIIMVGLTERQKKDLPSNIIKISKTNSIRELAEIYSCADVFMNPTLEDNFPTTNLEALACGTPVVTYDTGGSAESINSKCGIVVKKHDIIKLVEEIKKLKNNNLNSEDCIMQSENYDKKKCFKIYISLYKKISENKGEK